MIRSSAPGNRAARALTRGTSLLLLLLIAAPAAARTWVIHPGQSIQAAIDHAASGDAILVLPGEYREALVIEDKRLTLQGTSADRTTIVVVPQGATGETNGLLVTGSGARETAIAGLAFTTDEAHAPTAALAFRADAYVRDCRFAGIGSAQSRFDQGIAIDVGDDAQVAVSRCDFIDCGNGLRNLGGVMNVEQCSFIGCFAAISRPLCPIGSIRVSASRFVECDYSISGGGATVTVEDCDFDNCSRGIDAGCLDVVIRRCRFNDLGVGRDVQGPAIFLRLGDGLIEDCVIRGSIAVGWPGLVYAQSPLRVVRCRFQNNDATIIAGFMETLEVSECVFSGNSRPGIDVTRVKSGTVTDCRFVDSVLVREHVGVVEGDTESSFSFERCEFSNNVFGTVLVWGTRISDCVFSDNQSVIGELLRATVVQRCTIVRNQARVGRGQFESCLIAGNRRLSAATYINCAVIGNAGQVTRSSALGSTFIANDDFTFFGPLTGCIMRGNTPLGNVSSTLDIRQLSYSNTDEPLDRPFTTPGPGNIDADPIFMRDPHPGPDQTWGTPDDDYGDLRLRHGSPCIDAADSTAFPEEITTDAAGNPRFVDDPATPDTGLPSKTPPRPVADIGAYEFQPAAAPACPCDTNSDGEVTVADLLAYFDLYFTRDPAADLNADGRTDTRDLLDFIRCFTPRPTACP